MTVFVIPPHNNLGVSAKERYFNMTMQNMQIFLVSPYPKHSHVLYSHIKLVFFLTFYYPQK